MSSSPLSDLSSVYNGHYRYFLEEKELKQFLIAPKPVRDKIETIFYRLVVSDGSDSPTAVITLGSPRCGKTTLMRKHIADFGYTFTHICSQDIRKEVGDRTAGTVHLVLAHLIKSRFSFCLSSSSSDHRLEALFHFLTTSGYTIKLNQITKPIWWKDTFIPKIGLVEERVADTFLKYVTNWNFYFQEGEDKPVLAAAWVKAAPGSHYLAIFDHVIYNRIKEAHNQIVYALGTPGLSWERTIEDSIKKQG
jgi:hypothetical protein